MSHSKYLIVGGGMSADAAVRGIRDVDASGSIGLICGEECPPYKRPPLSKGLWKGDPEDGIWYGTERRGVELHVGRKVEDIDLANHRVVDGSGEAYSYEKLLLATGATPRRLPFGGDRVIHFRTVHDYRQLRSLTERGGRFAVIGGGFIGAEIAAALAMNGKEAVLIFPGESIGDRIFPRDLGLFLNDFYRGKGVEVHAEETVVGLETRGERIVVTTRGVKGSSGGELLVDGVVAGIGVAPDVELAGKAGIPTEDGILVDEFLRAGRPDVFAAGDVASFPNPALGKRIRVEHEDNAKAMGRIAGRAMAGAHEPYRHLPFFYSDLFDLGYEAAGELDPRLETVADWTEPHRKGVVYYLRNGRVRGVLLWNVWDHVDAARDLIAAPGPFRPEDLMGRLPSRRDVDHD